MKAGRDNRTHFADAGLAGQIDRTGSRLKRAPRIWYIDDGGHLAMQRVRTGISDGSRTEILSAPEIKEGMQVISGIMQESPAPQSSSLQQTMPGPGFGRRGF